MLDSCSRCRLFCLLAVLLVQQAGIAGCSGQTAPKSHMVAMSDGVELATDVYLPEKEVGPFPTVLVRTPYNKAGGKAIAANFVRQGNAVVVQDLRGRFASEGHLEETQR